MASALILMDYQEAICRADGIIGEPSGMGAEATRRSVLANAAKALAAARDAGVTVIHSRVAFDENFTKRTNRSEVFAQMGSVLLEGSEHVRFCSEVEPRPEEPVITRAWVNPFLNSPMEGLLRGKGISTVFLGGVATNYVVESAARHAADLGYETYVVDDLCSSLGAAEHEFAVGMLPVWAEVIGLDRCLELLPSGAAR
jgi:nicotinamidase-related amidase